MNKCSDDKCSDDASPLGRADGLMMQRLTSAPYENIVLIGPMGAGKTTAAGLIGKTLGQPVVELDEFVYAYAQEIGWSGNEANRIYDEKGTDAFNEYDVSFHAYAVEQVLLRYPKHIIDMGGAQTVSDNPERFARVRKALEPYKNVVLLLPFPDPEASLRILETRRRKPYPAYLVYSPCNAALAKHKIYTAGKTPEQVRDEILRCTSPFLVRHESQPLEGDERDAFLAGNFGPVIY